MDIHQTSKAKNKTCLILRFEYGDLIGLEITGASKVVENFSASYKALAYYDNNKAEGVTNLALWAVEPNSIANIQAGLPTMGLQ